MVNHREVVKILKDNTKGLFKAFAIAIILIRSINELYHFREVVIYDAITDFWFWLIIAVIWLGYTYIKEVVRNTIAGYQYYNIRINQNAKESNLMKEIDSIIQDIKDKYKEEKDEEDVFTPVPEVSEEAKVW